MYSVCISAKIRLVQNAKLLAVRRQQSPNLIPG